MPALSPAFSWANGLGRVFFAGFDNWYSCKPQAKNFFSGIYCLEKRSVTPTALMRRDRWKQCSLSAALYTYLRICICVTNCDVSTDIHCVFWAACTDTVPALSPAFSRANGFDRECFLQVLITGIVANHKQKISSQVFIALSECRSHQLH